MNSQISLVSQGEFDFRQLFTCVATYKGTIVAVRKIRKKHVELTRNIKKELKMVSYCTILTYISGIVKFSKIFSKIFVCKLRLDIERC